MKKIYLNPKMDIIKIKTYGMIATSDPQVTADPTETPVDAGSVESRFFSFDEDE